MGRGEDGAPVEVDPDATLSLDDALKALYVRVALVAQRLPPRHPSYFHLVKAGDRLARAYKCSVADRAGRN